MEFEGLFPTSRCRITEFGHTVEMSLADFPIEILQLIIGWLTQGNVDIYNKEGVVYRDGLYPLFVYNLNQIRCVGHYQDLISLSSTCTKFRRLLGPFIFKNFSLIRLNNVDVILGSHWGQSELFSDKKKYNREFMKELLAINSENCLISDLARTSFKQGIIGDSSQQSRYNREFSINNFITYLEVDSTMLVGSNLSQFHNLTSLKILDTAYFDFYTYTLPPLENLTELSIRGDILSTLQYIPPSLKRLDVMLVLLQKECLDAIETLHDTFETKLLNLVELNMFFDTREALNYDEILNLLEIVADNCLKLENINFRKLRRNVNIDSEFSNSIYNSLNFYKIVKKFENIRHIGIDVKILNTIMDDTLFVDRLKLTNRANLPLANMGLQRSMTVFDYSTTSPILTTNAIKLLSDIIRCIGITEFNFQFNESHNRSRDNAINLVLSVVSFQTQIYSKQLEKVSIMPCWSLTDGHLKRSFYRDCIIKNNELPNKVWQQSLASALIGDKISCTNSSKFKDKEIFDVIYLEHILDGYLGFPPSPVIFQAKLQPCEDNEENNLNQNQYSTSRSFWSVETSLSEMEHYSAVVKRPPTPPYN
ncbi:uncharacterized protein RJT21DRAFT_31723 [Scheffersomyces amazonensis]|uniref:uncharacterized protein n=1 Tax=Scheffersomyces amazonensis TaxID=1078765 RepID=UPI00315D5440